MASSSDSASGRAPSSSSSSSVWKGRTHALDCIQRTETLFSTFHWQNLCNCLEGNSVNGLEDGSVQIKSPCRITFPALRGKRKIHLPTSGMRKPVSLRKGCVLLKRRLPFSWELIKISYLCHWQLQIDQIFSCKQHCVTKGHCQLKPDKGTVHTKNKNTFSARVFPDTWTLCFG